jgi:hypothetical protein
LRANHLITSTGTEKAFDKIQHSFMIKALKKIWYGSSFNIINAAYDKPSQYPPEIISSNIRNKTNMLFSLFLFRIILEVLGRGTQQQKEKKKGIQNRMFIDMSFYIYKAQIVSQKRVKNDKVSQC